MSNITYANESTSEFSINDIRDDNTKCLLMTNNISSNKDRNVKALKLSEFRKWLSESVSVPSNTSITPKCCLTFISATSSFSISVTKNNQQIFITNSLVQSDNTNKSITINVSGFGSSYNITLFPTDSCRIFSYKSNNTNYLSYSTDTMLEKAFPIGTYYFSYAADSNGNAINPANYFGGVWEQITSKFLVSAGTITFSENDVEYNYNFSAGQSYCNKRRKSDNSNIGNIYGEDKHLLEYAEIPSHSHTIYRHAHTWSNFYDNGWGVDYDIEDNANGCYMFRKSGDTTKNTKSVIQDNSTSYQLNDTHGNYTGSALDTSNSQALGGSKHNNMPKYIQIFCWRRTS